MSRKEYLSQDILEERFARCFRPIHVAQILLGCSRVDTRDGFLTPPSRAQKIVTILWIFSTCIAIYLLVSYYHETYYNKNPIMYLTFTVGFIMQYLAYLFNMIQSKFYNGEQNVKLYLMLQKVDRHFRMLEEFKIAHNNQHIYNYFAVVLLFFYFASGFVYYIFHTVSIPKFTMLLIGAFVTLHIELLLTIGLIYFLCVRLGLLNRIIEESGFDDVGSRVLGFKSIPTLGENNRVPHVRGVRESQKVMSLEEIKTCLRHILKGYSFVAELFQFQVFNVVTAAFCYTIVAIEAVVLGLRLQIVPVPVTIAIGLWLYLFTLQVLQLVIVNDWFARHVDGTKSMCVRALSLVYEGPVYKTAKEMVSLIELDQPIFNVYGVFELNKYLPLTMLGVLTSNIVVLLQFTIS